ncbi:amidohydrolase [Peribacillus sp. SCS-155]|uniref:amidohydrolase n=1 Tax=Peribacillus sedimenti TaxID=3115297 RepID=UPI003906B475
MNPMDYIDQHQSEIETTYHALHSLAEPSWKEEQTSRYIRERLTEAGLSVKTFSGHYGLIAEIPGQSSEIVALRADMDALVQEVDGVVKPNHSCGHDAHSTMVLYAALSIAASGVTPKHTLRFIFQPAEEKGEGALQMMNEGALENVTKLFGVHLRPKVEVPFNKASAAIMHASAGSIIGTIKGRQAHAARPKEGINAIEAAALIVQKLKQMDLQTEIPHSIKMTRLIVENEASNVIPETAVFTLDARAQSNEVMQELMRQAKEAIKESAHETGAVISLSREECLPAATLNPEAMKLAERAIAEILGKDNVTERCVSQGGEDFHFYTVKNPGLKATMVGLGCDLAPGLHHPQMSFQLKALHYGAKILTKTVLLASENK